MQPMVPYFYPGMKRRCRGEAFQIPKQGACFGSFIPMEMSQVGLQGLHKCLWKLVLPSFPDMARGGEHSLNAIYILFRELLYHGHKWQKVWCYQVTPKDLGSRSVLKSMCETVTPFGHLFPPSSRRLWWKTGLPSRGTTKAGPPADRWASKGRMIHLHWSRCFLDLNAS